MYLDSSLRIEIISSLLGQTIKSCDKKRRGTTAGILSVDEFHLHNLIGKRKAYGKEPFINEEDFFDPDYDCDFTDLSDSAECTRGDEHYERPKGWYRMALKVKGKYPDGDTWLGTQRWRTHSVPGEWPVSYHGTSLKGAKGIIRSHYKAGDGALHGRGIYSTPDIHVAEREEYATTFTSKTTGKSYKLILQNRINPKKREICQRFDYWLIPVSEGTSAREEKKIVENSIRPYGILIKELNDDDEEDTDGDGNGDGTEDYDDDNADSKYDDGSVDDNGDDDDYDDGNSDSDGDNNESDNDGSVDDDYSDEDDCDDDTDHYDPEVDDINYDDGSVDDNGDDDDYDDGNSDSDGDDNESDNDGSVNDDYSDEDDCDDDTDHYDPEVDDINYDDGSVDHNGDDDDYDEGNGGDGEDGESGDDGNVDDSCSNEDGGDDDDDDNDDYDDDNDYDEGKYEDGDAYDNCDGYDDYGDEDDDENYYDDWS